MKVEDFNLRFNCISTVCKCKENSCQLSRLVPVGSPVLTAYFILVDGKILVKNESGKILSAPNDVHPIGLPPTYDYNMNEVAFDSSNYECNDPANNQEKQLAKTGLQNANKIDISRVPLQLQDKVRKAHIQYSNVFAPDLSKRYNGHSGSHMVRLQSAVKTPYKSLRVLTRSGQGLLNQEIEMAQLLTKVQGEEIEEGNVMILADDGQVGGSDVEMAADNWITALKMCSKNNIKSGYNKVKIFPEVSLIHGWVFKDGHIQPDPHRTLELLEMKTPITVREMRTYMGVFKTFSLAIPRLSNLMPPFEKLCAGKESEGKPEWNGGEFENVFNESKAAAKESIKTLAFPHPDEQVFIVPDAACRDAESKKPAPGFISNELTGYRKYYNKEYKDGSKNSEYLIEGGNQIDEHSVGPLNRVINPDTSAPI